MRHVLHETNKAVMVSRVIRHKTKAPKMANSYELYGSQQTTAIKVRR